MPETAPGPPPDDDLIAEVEALAISVAGETFNYFRERCFARLPDLSAEALCALSAHLYFRSLPDQGCFALVYACEQRKPVGQRLSPEALLEQMRARGFRRPPTMALRRAERAFKAELDAAPPPDGEREYAERIVVAREQLRQVMEGRARVIETKGGDPLMPRHRAVLLAAEAAGVERLDESALMEIEELLFWYHQNPMIVPAPAPLLSAEQRPMWLN